jgi:hypothetical protein
MRVKTNCLSASKYDKGTLNASNATWGGLCDHCVQTTNATTFKMNKQQANNQHINKQMQAQTANMMCKQTVSCEHAKKMQQ